CAAHIPASPRQKATSSTFSNPINRSRFFMTRSLLRPAAERPRKMEVHTDLNVGTATWGQQRGDSNVGTAASAVQPSAARLAQLFQFLMSGAIEGTRTPTPLPVHGPEPCASANSATMASGLKMQQRPEGRRQEDLHSYSHSHDVLSQTASRITLRSQISEH